MLDKLKAIADRYFEVERLISMRFDELKMWYKELIPILKHNNFILKEDRHHFNKLIERIS